MTRQASSLLNREHFLMSVRLNSILRTCTSAYNHVDQSVFWPSDSGSVGRRTLEIESLFALFTKQAISTYSDYSVLNFGFHKLQRNATIF